MHDTDTPSRLEPALRYATLGLLLWLPLPLGSNRDWSSGLAIAAIGLLASLRAWSWLGRPSSGLSSSMRAALPLLGLLAVTQLWVAVQWAFGLTTDSGETFRYLMLGVGYSLLFLLIIDLFHTRRHLTLLLATLVLGGTFQAFYGTLMTLSGTEWLLFSAKEHGRGVATGTYVNRNHLAGYLEITLACGIGLLLALRDGRPWRWRDLPELLLGPKAPLRIALAIMVIGLVMTHSRMGNTAFFTGLLVTGGIFVLLHKRNRLRNALILASILAIDVLIVSQYFGLEELRDRLASTQLEDKVVAGEVVRRENVDRDDVAIYALPQLKDRPLTGFGAGAFEASFQQYPGSDVRSHFDHAHNDYLQFAIEYGVVGVIPLVAFVLLALYHALRALWTTRSPYRSGIGFAATMGILSLLIHSATDFNLQIPANAATFVTLCAIAVLANHGASRRAF